MEELINQKRFQSNSQLRNKELGQTWEDINNGMLLLLDLPLQSLSQILIQRQGKNSSAQQRHPSRFVKKEKQNLELQSATKHIKREKTQLNQGSRHSQQKQSSQILNRPKWHSLRKQSACALSGFGMKTITEEKGEDSFRLKSKSDFQSAHESSQIFSKNVSNIAFDEIKRSALADNYSPKFPKKYSFDKLPVICVGQHLHFQNHGNYQSQPRKGDRSLQKHKKVRNQLSKTSQVLKPKSKKLKLLI